MSRGRQVGRRSARTTKLSSMRGLFVVSLLLLLLLSISLVDSSDVDETGANNKDGKLKRKEKRTHQSKTVPKQKQHQLEQRPSQSPRRQQPLHFAEAFLGPGNGRQKGLKFHNTRGNERHVSSGVPKSTVLVLQQDMVNPNSNKLKPGSVLETGRMVNGNKFIAPDGSHKSIYHTDGRLATDGVTLWKRTESLQQQQQQKPSLQSRLDKFSLRISETVKSEHEQADRNYKKAGRNAVIKTMDRLSNQVFGPDGEVSLKGLSDAIEKEGRDIVLDTTVDMLKETAKPFDPVVDMFQAHHERRLGNVNKARDLEASAIGTVLFKSVAPTMSIRSTWFSGETDRGKRTTATRHGVNAEFLVIMGAGMSQQTVKGENGYSSSTTAVTVNAGKSAIASAGIGEITARDPPKVEISSDNVLTQTQVTRVMQGAELRGRVWEHDGTHHVSFYDKVRTVDTRQCRLDGTALSTHNHINMDSSQGSWSAAQFAVSSTHTQTISQRDTNTDTMQTISSNQHDVGTYKVVSGIDKPGHQMQRRGLGTFAHSKGTSGEQFTSAGLYEQRNIRHHVGIDEAASYTSMRVEAERGTSVVYDTVQRDFSSYDFQSKHEMTSNTQTLPDGTTHTHTRVSESHGTGQRYRVTDLGTIPSTRADKATPPNHVPAPKPLEARVDIEQGHRTVTTTDTMHGTAHNGLSDTFHSDVTKTRYETETHRVVAPSQADAHHVLKEVNSIMKQYGSESGIVEAGHNAYEGVSRDISSVSAASHPQTALSGGGGSESLSSLDSAISADRRSSTSLSSSTIQSQQQQQQQSVMSIEITEGQKLPPWAQGIKLNEKGNVDDLLWGDLKPGDPAVVEGKDAVYAPAEGEYVLERSNERLLETNRVVVDRIGNQFYSTTNIKDTTTTYTSQSTDVAQTSSLTDKGGYVSSTTHTRTSWRHDNPFLSFSHNTETTAVNGQETSSRSTMNGHLTGAGHSLVGSIGHALFAPKGQKPTLEKAALSLGRALVQDAVTNTLSEAMTEGAKDDASKAAGGRMAGTLVNVAVNIMDGNHEGVQQAVKEHVVNEVLNTAMEQLMDENPISVSYSKTRTEASGTMGPGQNIKYQKVDRHNVNTPLPIPFVSGGAHHQVEYTVYTKNGFQITRRSKGIGTHVGVPFINFASTVSSGTERSNWKRTDLSNGKVQFEQYRREFEGQRTWRLGGFGRVAQTDVGFAAKYDRRETLRYTFNKNFKPEKIHNLGRPTQLSYDASKTKFRGVSIGRGWSSSRVNAAKSHDSYAKSMMETSASKPSRKQVVMGKLDHSKPLEKRYELGFAGNDYKIVDGRHGYFEETVSQIQTDTVTSKKYGEEFRTDSSTKTLRSDYEEVLHTKKRHSYAWGLIKTKWKSTHYKSGEKRAIVGQDSDTRSVQVLTKANGEAYDKYETIRQSDVKGRGVVKTEYSEMARLVNKNEASNLSGDGDRPGLVSRGMLKNTEVERRVGTYRSRQVWDESDIIDKHEGTTTKISFVEMRFGSMSRTLSDSSQKVLKQPEPQPQVFVPGTLIIPVVEQQAEPSTAGAKVSIPKENQPHPNERLVVKEGEGRPEGNVFRQMQKGEQEVDLQKNMFKTKNDGSTFRSDSIGTRTLGGVTGDVTLHTTALETDIHTYTKLSGGGGGDTSGMSHVTGERSVEFIDHGEFEVWERTLQPQSVAGTWGDRTEGVQLQKWTDVCAVGSFTAKLGKHTSDQFHSKGTSSTIQGLDSATQANLDQFQVDLEQQRGDATKVGDEARSYKHLSTRSIENKEWYSTDSNNPLATTRDPNESPEVATRALEKGEVQTYHDTWRILETDVYDQSSKEGAPRVHTSRRQTHRGVETKRTGLESSTFTRLADDGETKLSVNKYTDETLYSNTKESFDVVKETSGKDAIRSPQSSTGSDQQQQQQEGQNGVKVEDPHRHVRFDCEQTSRQDNNLMSVQTFEEVESVDGVSGSVRLFKAMERKTVVSEWNKDAIPASENNLPEGQVQADRLADTTKVDVRVTDHGSFEVRAKTEVLSRDTIQEGGYKIFGVHIGGNEVQTNRFRESRVEGTYSGHRHRETKTNLAGGVSSSATVNYLNSVKPAGGNLNRGDVTLKPTQHIREDVQTWRNSDGTAFKTEETNTENGVEVETFKYAHFGMQAGDKIVVRSDMERETRDIFTKDAGSGVNDPDFKHSVTRDVVRGYEVRTEGVTNDRTGSSLGGLRYKQTSEARATTYGFEQVTDRPESSLSTTNPDSTQVSSPDSSLSSSSSPPSSSTQSSSSTAPKETISYEAKYTKVEKSTVKRGLFFDHVEHEDSYYIHGEDGEVVTNDAGERINPERFDKETKQNLVMNDVVQDEVRMSKHTIKAGQAALIGGGTHAATEVLSDILKVGFFEGDNYKKILFNQDRITNIVQGTVASAGQGAVIGFADSVATELWASSVKGVGGAAAAGLGGLISTVQYAMNDKSATPLKTGAVFLADAAVPAATAILLPFPIYPQWRDKKQAVRGTINPFGGGFKVVGGEMHHDFGLECGLSGLVTAATVIASGGTAAPALAGAKATGMMATLDRLVPLRIGMRLGGFKYELSNAAKESQEFSAYGVSTGVHFSQLFSLSSTIGGHETTTYEKAVVDKHGHTTHVERVEGGWGITPHFQVSDRASYFTLDFSWVRGTSTTRTIQVAAEGKTLGCDGEVTSNELKHLAKWARNMPPNMVVKKQLRKERRTDSVKTVVEPKGFKYERKETDVEKGTITEELLQERKGHTDRNMKVHLETIHSTVTSSYEDLRKEVKQSIGWIWNGKKKTKEFKRGEKRTEKVTSRQYNIHQVRDAKDTTPQSLPHSSAAGVKGEMKLFPAFETETSEVVDRRDDDAKIGYYKKNKVYVDGRFILSTPEKKLTLKGKKAHWNGVPTKTAQIIEATSVGGSFNYLFKLGAVAHGYMANQLGEPFNQLRSARDIGARVGAGTLRAARLSLLSDYEIQARSEGFTFKPSTKITTAMKLHVAQDKQPLLVHNSKHGDVVTTIRAVQDVLTTTRTIDENKNGIVGLQQGQPEYTLERRLYGSVIETSKMDTPKHKLKAGYVMETHQHTKISSLEQKEKFKGGGCKRVFETSIPRIQSGHNSVTAIKDDTLKQTSTLQHHHNAQLLRHLTKKEKSTWGVPTKMNKQRTVHAITGELTLFPTHVRETTSIVDDRPSKMKSGFIKRNSESVVGHFVLSSNRKTISKVNYKFNGVVSQSCKETSVAKVVGSFSSLFRTGGVASGEHYTKDKKNLHELPVSTPRTKLEGEIPLPRSAGGASFYQNEHKVGKKDLETTPLSVEYITARTVSAPPNKPFEETKKEHPGSRDTTHTTVSVIQDTYQETRDVDKQKDGKKKGGSFFSPSKSHTYSLERISLGMSVRSSSRVVSKKKRAEGVLFESHRSYIASTYGKTQKFKGKVAREVYESGKVATPKQISKIQNTEILKSNVVQHMHEAERLRVASKTEIDEWSRKIETPQKVAGVTGELSLRTTHVRETSSLVDDRPADKQAGFIKRNTVLATGSFLLESNEKVNELSVKGRTFNGVAVEKATLTTWKHVEGTFSSVVRRGVGASGRHYTSNSKLSKKLSNETPLNVLEKVELPSVVSYSEQHEVGKESMEMDSTRSIVVKSRLFTANSKTPFRETIETKPIVKNVEGQPVQRTVKSVVLSVRDTLTHIKSIEKDKQNKKVSVTKASTSGLVVLPSETRLERQLIGTVVDTRSWEISKPTSPSYPKGTLFEAHEHVSLSTSIRKEEYEGDIVDTIYREDKLNENKYKQSRQPEEIKLIPQQHQHFGQRLMIASGKDIEKWSRKMKSVQKIAGVTGELSLRTTHVRETSSLVDDRPADKQAGFIKRNTVLATGSFLLESNEKVNELSVKGRTFNGVAVEKATLTTWKHVEGTFSSVVRRGVGASGRHYTSNSKLSKKLSNETPLNVLEKVELPTVVSYSEQHEVGTCELNTDPVTVFERHSCIYVAGPNAPMVEFEEKKGETEASRTTVYTVRDFLTRAYQYKSSDEAKRDEHDERNTKLRRELFGTHIKVTTRDVEEKKLAPKQISEWHQHRTISSFAQTETHTGQDASDLFKNRLTVSKDKPEREYERSKPSLSLNRIHHVAHTTYEASEEEKQMWSGRVQSLEPSFEVLGRKNGNLDLRTTATREISEYTDDRPTSGGFEKRNRLQALGSFVYETTTELQQLLGSEASYNGVPAKQAMQSERETVMGSFSAVVRRGGVFSGDQSGVGCIRVENDIPEAILSRVELPSPSHYVNQYNIGEENLEVKPHKLHRTKHQRYVAEPRNPFSVKTKVIVSDSKYEEVETKSVVDVDVTTRDILNVPSSSQSREESCEHEVDDSGLELVSSFTTTRLTGQLLFVRLFKPTLKSTRFLGLFPITETAQTTKTQTFISESERDNLGISDDITRDVILVKESLVTTEVKSVKSMGLFIDSTVTTTTSYTAREDKSLDRKSTKHTEDVRRGIGLEDDVNESEPNPVENPAVRKSSNVVRSFSSGSSRAIGALSSSLTYLVLTRSKLKMGWSDVESLSFSTTKSFGIGTISGILLARSVHPVVGAAVMGGIGLATSPAPVNKEDYNEWVPPATSSIREGLQFVVTSKGWSRGYLAVQVVGSAMDGFKAALDYQSGKVSLKYALEQAGKSVAKIGLGMFSSAVVTALMPSLGTGLLASALSISVSSIAYSVSSFAADSATVEWEDQERKWHRYRQLCERFQIKETATKREVKKAVRVMCLKKHPDKRPNAEFEQANSEFARLLQESQEMQVLRMMLGQDKEEKTTVAEEGDGEENDDEDEEEVKGKDEMELWCR